MQKPNSAIVLGVHIRTGRHWRFSCSYVLIAVDIFSQALSRLQFTITAALMRPSAAAAQREE
jgi:hypothetical protein